MSHTPGPWEPYAAMTGVNVEEWGLHDSEGQPAEGWWIKGPQFVEDSDGNQFFGEANARLIAAAPDLLEALKLLYAGFEGLVAGNPNIDAEAREVIMDAEFGAPAIARAALAKAEP